MRPLQRMNVASAAVLLLAAAAFGQGGVIIDVDQGLTDAVLARKFSAQVRGGSVTDVFRTVSDRADVPVQVDLRVSHVLPGPAAMPIRNIAFTNVALGEALEALCVQFGLRYEVRTDRIWIEPAPPLLALGRRATVREVVTLSRLRGANLQGGVAPVTLTGLLAFIHSQTGIPSDLSEEMAASAAGRTWSFPAEVSLAAALDALCEDLGAAWTVAEGRISLLGYQEMDRRRIEVQLATPATVDFAGIPLYAVISELARQAEVTVYFEPGSLLLLPAATREQFSLQMRGATVRQAFETIAGVTGLAYRIEPDGVYFGVSEAATAVGPHAGFRENPMVAFMRFEVGAMQISVPIRKDDLAEPVYQVLMQRKRQYLQELSTTLAPPFAPPNFLTDEDD